MSNTATSHPFRKSYEDDLEDDDMEDVNDEDGRDAIQPERSPSPEIRTEIVTYQEIHAKLRETARRNEVSKASW